MVFLLETHYLCNFESSNSDGKAAKKVEIRFNPSAITTQEKLRLLHATRYFAFVLIIGEFPCKIFEFEGKSSSIFVSKNHDLLDSSWKKDRRFCIFMNCL